MEKLREEVQDALKLAQEKLANNENLKHDDIEVLLLHCLMLEESN